MGSGKGGDFIIANFEEADIIWCGFFLVATFGGENDFVVAVMVKIDDAFNKDSGKRFAGNIDTMEIVILHSEEIIRIVVENLDFGEVTAKFASKINAVFGIFDVQKGPFDSVVGLNFEESVGAVVVPIDIENFASKKTDFGIFGETDAREDFGNV